MEKDHQFFCFLFMFMIELDKYHLFFLFPAVQFTSNRFLHEIDAYTLYDVIECVYMWLKM